MGKTSRKLHKKTQKLQQYEGQQKVEQLKVRLAGFEADMNYAEAINTLAELIDQGDHEPELYYKIAWNYYNLNDYDRAASWVNNTLSAVPGHVDARILLGKLCLLNDRIDDALAIFEFVLDNYENGLSNEQQESLEEVLCFYGKHQHELLIKSYPHILKFLDRADGQPASAVVTDTMPATELPMAQKHKEGNVSLAAAQGALSRLKAMMEQQKTAISANDSVAGSAKIKPVARLGQEKIVEPETVIPVPSEPERTPSVDGIRLDILAKPVSLLDKVHLFNSFAASYYFSQDYSSAESLLRAALELDQTDEQTLRNLAVLQKDMRQGEQALATAGRLPQADFLLLRALRSPDC